MANWFTTQDPTVLEREPGIWVRPGLEDSPTIKKGDLVFIHEVAKGGGASAVVALVKVSRLTRIEEDGWTKIAEANFVLKASPPYKCSYEKVLKILGRESLRSFGKNQNHLLPIVKRQFNEIVKYFPNYKKMKQQFKIRETQREMEVKEGDEQIAEIRFRKRNAALIIEKKRNSNYCCEVCGMSYQDIYGERGQEYIIAHHSNPLAMRKTPETTTLEDLNLICANCHAMLHHHGLMTVKQLISIIKEHANN